MVIWFMGFRRRAISLDLHLCMYYGLTTLGVLFITTCGLGILYCCRWTRRSVVLGRIRCLVRFFNAHAMIPGEHPARLSTAWYAWIGYRRLDVGDRLALPFVLRPTGSLLDILRPTGSSTVASAYGITRLDGTPGTLAQDEATRSSSLPFGAIAIKWQTPTSWIRSRCSSKTSD